jgi:hypothetical protein
MAEASTIAAITHELYFVEGFARTAQLAYSAGNATRGNDALRNAWRAWERAARSVLSHEAESLYPKLLELEALLHGLEGKSPKTNRFTATI